MTHTTLRTLAINLRKHGYSYSMIADKTGLSKGTLYSWLSSIPYEPNNEVVYRIGNARAKSGLVKHKNKLKTVEEARKQAIKDIGKVSKRDLLMLGIALYIGEGEKNENVGIINADPRIIRLAIKWLIDIYGLSINNFTLAVHLYPDSDIETCLHYWSKQTNIPLTQFGKTQIDKRKNKVVSKRGKLPYGTAHLRVKSNGVKEFGVLLARRIRASMEEILGEK